MKLEDQEKFLKLIDGELLGLTLYFEARGEPVQGIIAVGNVVRTRAKERKKDYKEIILTPKTFGYEQFSYLNTNDSQYSKAVTMAQDFIAGKMPEDLTGALQECRWLAYGIINGSLRDNTKGANHYFNPKVCNPSWADKMTITCKIGNHVFLRG